MFEKSLKEKLGRIFAIKKVTYDAPSSAQEQEAVFISVENCRSSIKDKLEIAKVTGKVRLFVNSEKYPFGNMAKAIAAAKLADTKDLFFFGIEDNVGTYQNLVERSASFVYFFSSQYNPDRGQLNKVTFDLESN